MRESIENKPEHRDGGVNKPKHSAHFTRHSRAGYKTYAKILASEDPTKAVDVEGQIVPDLTEKGVELAVEKAEALFDELNPNTDELFFVSSSEARALETAAIYKEVAQRRGFRVIRPDSSKGTLAKEIGGGDIRVVKSLSLNIENTLLSAVFNPDTTLADVNLENVDEETVSKWQKAREIINRDDKGSWGANFYAHSERVKELFPEIESAKDTFETQFRNILRLAEFGIKKAEQSGAKGQIKILAFGHENYFGYALGQYFADHEIKNCETIDIELEGDKLHMKRRGERRAIE